ncbi:MAG TPA: EscU/YscU/HrcU family type III secretion system export apparatus switch protein, partial [Povalibacter sp.]
MADNKSSQSKTEPPTQKRLRDLRRKGQVAKSRDVPATAVVIAGVTFLALAGHLLIGGISAMVNEAASFDFRTLTNTSVMTHWAASLFTRMLVLTLPFVLILAAVSALASFLQTGPVFSLDPVKPQLSRINPIEGARRLFSLSTVVEFLKLLVKALVLALLLWMLGAHWLPELLRSHWLETNGVLPLATAVLASLSWLAAACFMCTTVFDVWFQRWNFSKQNRMTFDEVRREHKETEGDPHVRNRRR